MITESSVLRKQVRLIEIKTRRLTDAVLAGQYHSAFKGRGMTFSEVREYGYGDDLRSIDWNVTARYNHPFVKVHEEERELTVMLIIDVSASNIFGSTNLSKKERIAEIAGTLAFSAMRNNDKVGVVLFTDRIEKFIPPKKGNRHVLRIIRELISFEPKSKGTSISQALEFAYGVTKRRAIIFLMSDFAAKGYERALGITARRHDVVALRIFDPLEMRLPEKGLLMLEDAETGLKQVVDFEGPIGQAYRKWMHNNSIMLNEIAAKYNVDVLNVSTIDDYVRPLASLFKKREKRV